MTESPAVRRRAPDDVMIHARDAVVDELLERGDIVDKAVEVAFRTVPRHRFVPAGIAPETVYAVDESIRTVFSADGMTLSSVSAMFIQARMIQQAGIRAGMRVLEIGSGGYNAALLAEIVGEAGEVVSVDIDESVTERARRALAATGYADRIRVVTADAESPIPGVGAVDAVLVTVGAWDVPSAWLDQLTSDGALVVPLRMNGITRSIGFRREADRLVSTSAEVCGFVPMQGVGEHDEPSLSLPDRTGGVLILRFDEGFPDSPERLDGALADDPIEVWSGVRMSNGVSFADLHLWLATTLPGFCRLNAENPDQFGTGRGTWWPFAVVADCGMAILAARPLPDASGIEFGARSWGARPERATEILVEGIQSWDRETRHQGEPSFTYWPGRAVDASLPSPTDARTERLVKKHGLLTVAWPLDPNMSDREGEPTP